MVFVSWKRSIWGRVKVVLVWIACRGYEWFSDHIQMKFLKSSHVRNDIYWLFKPLNSQFRVVLKLSLQLENSIQGWTNSNVVLHNRTRLGPDCGLPGHLRALHQQTSRRWAWQLWHRGEEAVGSQMQRKVIQKLGGGFKYFSFSPLFGEDSHFD